jgi:hypothetical protein
MDALEVQQAETAEEDSPVRSARVLRAMGLIALSVMVIGHGGTTWTAARNIGVIQPLPGSLQLLDSNHAWFGAMAGTKAVLERTVDGGITWEMIGLPAVTP